MNSSSENSQPWWKKTGGLRFSCTGCGKCCSGEPGAVWLSDLDQKNIAAKLGLDLGTFQRRYCRLIDDQVALREVRRTVLGSSAGVQHDCIFLEDGRTCKIYEDRPVQCRTFPFWPDALETRSSWEKLRHRGCEGVEAGDVVIDIATIEEQLHQTLEAPGFEN